MKYNYYSRFGHMAYEAGYHASEIVEDERTRLNGNEEFVIMMISESSESDIFDTMETKEHKRFDGNIDFEYGQMF